MAGPERRALEGLSVAWKGHERFVVLELGFDLGHHFLATWAAWRADPHRPRLLHYAATVPHPVAATELLRGLAPWPEVSPLAQQLAQRWWGLLPGTHRLSLDNGQVLLTLGVAEPSAWLDGQRFLADAIHVGGNQAVDPVLAQALARHARPGSTITCPPTAWVALDGAGFQSNPDTGPPIRQGVFTPAWAAHKPLPQPPPPGRVVVVGAGLAGAAVAASLARRGCDVAVLDRAPQPAAGASGLPAGLFGPHLSADDAWLSQITRAGVRATWEQLIEWPELDGHWSASGILEHRVARGRHWPHGATPQGQEWTTVANAHTLAAAGLPENAPAWWHARAGWAQPAHLVCALLAQPGITWRGGVDVRGLRREGDVWVMTGADGLVLERCPWVVVAAGPATRALVPAPLPLHALRGQVTGALHSMQTPALPPFATNGHGCLIPAVPTPEGLAWFCGSTFDRGSDQPDIHPEDNQDNLNKLRELLPQLGSACADSARPSDLRAWSGVRCTVPDRVPLVGPVDAQRLPGLWVSTAMGARGLSLALLCGELAAAQHFQEPLPLDDKLARHLRVSRFK